MGEEKDWQKMEEEKRLVKTTFDAPDPPGIIQGRKFHDENANGRRDSEEDYLNGWTVELVNETGTVIDTAVTANVDLNNDGAIDPSAESGVYQFEVLPGDYVVREVQQPGWVQAAPSHISDLVVSGSQAATGAVWYALNSVTNELTYEISLSQLPGSLSSVTVRRGQPGQNGPQIYDLLQSGSRSGSDIVRGVVVVTPDHAHQLGAGQLHVDVQIAGGVSLSGLIINSGEHRVRVTGESLIANRDFGNYRSALISGRKYYDVNADAVRIPQPVIDLELFRQQNDFFEDAYGQNEKWLRSSSGAWYFLTPDGLLTQWDSTPLVAQGSPVAQLNERVYNNPELIFGAVNEPFLNGWTIELLNASGVVVASTRTRDIDLNGDGVIQPASETGWYRFAGLPPGDYSVREVMQDGWFQSATPTSAMAQLAFDLDSQFDFRDLGKFFTNFANAGEHWLQGADGTWYYLLPNGQLRIWDNASGGDNGPLRGTLLTRLDVTVYRNPGMLVNAADPTITLSSGDEYLTADFGNFESATIEGRKWHDDNRDGQRIPLEVQQLQLTQHNSSFYFNAYGDNESWFRGGDGQWYFLTPDGALSRWDRTPHTAQGELVAEIDDFFANDPAQLLQPQTEPYLNDFVIQLIDEFGNIVATDVTRDIDLNEDGLIDPEQERGWYSFTDVLPGTYTLREVQQDGWIQTDPVEPEFAELALELDAQFGFQSSGNLHRNFGGMDEVWIRDQAGDWYYILPDGQLFEWDRLSTDPLVGVLVAELSPQFHANPALLYNAQPIEVELFGGETISDYNFGNDLLDDVV